MKKTIWILVLVVLLFLLPAHAEEGQSLPEISVGTVSAEQTETFSVPVTISGNPGIAGISHVLYYDAEILSLQSVEPGALLTGKGHWAANGETPGTIRLTWFAGEDVTGDGTLFLLHFTVAADAPLGQTAITLNGADDLILLNAGEKLLPGVWHPGAVAVVEQTWHLETLSVQTAADGKTQTITVLPFHRADGKTLQGFVVAAACGEDGRQLAADLQPVTAPAEEAVELVLSAQEQISETKLFLLDASGFIPVCDVAIVEPE